MSRRITERIEELESMMDDMPSSDYVWESACDAARDVIDNYDFSGLLEDTVDRYDFSALEERVNELVREISGLRETVDVLQARIELLEV